MERKLWRKAIILSIILLALACCRAAHADELVLPAGTTIQLPRNGELIVVPAGESRFLVERESIDKSNAAFEMNRRLTKDLMQCSAVLQERKKPEAGWKVAARWTGFGAAIVGAFALGLSLR